VLLVGQIVKQITMRFKLPYTPILALFGLLVGASGLSKWPVVERWANISPHFIMLLFLPPILFESAFNCDWYVFKKQM
jgi:NhaP-type Na+/H+ or K+/H+ antiporter